jgi:transcriptional regulator with XRE-family HTH domain
MANVAHSIDLNLTDELRDRDFRQKFFLAESSAQIASQLIALRKRRDLNQQQVAELIGTQQPAISRVEKADYQSWSFNILRKIADALDARIRVLIEPAEDVLREYSADRDAGLAVLRPAISRESSEDVLREYRAYLEPTLALLGEDSFLQTVPGIVGPQGYKQQVGNLTSWGSENVMNAAHYHPIERKESSVLKLTIPENSAVAAKTSTTQ